MKITADVLRSAALEYLRYEQQCKLVCTERSPFPNDPCVPDVVGVTAKRKVIEIEIKVSWADFKINREKTSLFRRRFYGVKPWKYSFIVPPDLVDRVKEALEDGEGLMTVSAGSSLYTGLPKVVVIKSAPYDKDSQELRLREIVKMVSHQTGTLTSAMAKVARLKEELRTISLQEKQEK
jgi:hypothetical protein